MSRDLQDREMRGCVFSIQKFSVHDGPGIRTLVFLKGCGMRCWWCSNPESQNPHPEKAYNENRCLGLDACVRCVEVCIPGAISRAPNGKIAMDRARCESCAQPCVDACPARSVIRYGQTLSVDEVLRVVEEDSQFYSRSGGGMTLSGGEPLLQRDFMLALLREGKRRRIGVSMETGGYAPWENLRDACRLLDSILYDIKSLNPEKHLEQTGVPLAPVLENFTRMAQANPSLEIHVRTPIIPGFNDSVSEILPIAELAARCPNADFEMLPYHRLGEQKYLFLGRSCRMGETRLGEEVMEALHAAVKKRSAVKLHGEAPCSDSR
jgi:pyruvate formate lyase activating enzyme